MPKRPFIAAIWLIAPDAQFTEVLRPGLQPCGMTASPANAAVGETAAGDWS